jgi:Periplasmic protease
MTGVRLTTARYYTPSGESIQGKGIIPDILVKQGKFESFNYQSFSESDLKDSLDKDETNEEVKENGKETLSEKEEKLANDFQLQRALDLIKGLSLYKESLE